MYKSLSTNAIINLKALSNNLDKIRKIIGSNIKILAVIKADAYGHGMVPIAKKLCQSGINILGICYVEDGIALRKENIKLPILVMGGAFEEDLEQIIDNNLMITIYDYHIAKKLSEIAIAKDKIAVVHIKIDTGMGRLGFRIGNALDQIISIMNLPNICVEGIFTHFASADSDISFSNMQLERFNKIIGDLKKEGKKIEFIHAANSAGIVNFTKSHFNMVRTGIMLYGACENLGIELEPVMMLIARVLQFKTIVKGESVSYGRSYICSKDRDIAIISIGYSDGLIRSMSNKAHALIKGIRVPIIGTICMDMAILDVTGISGIKIGDEVVMIGKQHDDRITVDDWARWGDTIPYEILCSVGSRVQRVYLKESLDSKE